MLISAGVLSLFVRAFAATAAAPPAAESAAAQQCTCGTAQWVARSPARARVVGTMRASRPRNEVTFTPAAVTFLRAFARCNTRARWDPRADSTQHEGPVNACHAAFLPAVSLRDLLAAPSRDAAPPPPMHSALNDIAADGAGARIRALLRSSYIHATCIHYQ